MTTYNTGNPIGSTAVKDLFDNAQNMDYAMNVESPSWRDRFGKLRESFAGMEMAANSNILALGLIWVGDYVDGVAGPQLTARNQYFVRGGARYRIAPGTTLPHTLTGTWATDQPNTVLIGDERLEVRVTSFGAVGDGVVDDSAAFNECRDYVGAIGGKMIIDGNRRYYLPNGLDLSGFSKMDVIGEPGAVIWVGTPTLNMHAVRGVNCDRITIHGLQFECVPVIRTLAVFAIYFQQSSFIVVSGCKMYDFLSNCWMHSSSDSHMFKNIGFRTTADGFHFSHGSHDCSFVGNETREAKDDHFSITTYVDTSLPGNADQRTKRIRFINNVARGGTWGNGLAVYGADNVFMEGNEIYQVARNGIGVLGFADPVPNSRITIIGNLIDGTASATRVPVSEATGGDPATDPLVGNADNCGMCIQAIDVQIKNNVIKNVAGTAPTLKSGISLQNFKRIDISGNTLDSIDGVGVWIESGMTGEDLILTDNNFRNISSTVIRLTGMNAGNLMIKGNTAIAPYGTGSGFFMELNNMTIKIMRVGNVGADPTKTTSIVSCPNVESNYNVPA